jgi:hypothetical protein
MDTLITLLLTMCTPRQRWPSCARRAPFWHGSYRFRACNLFAFLHVDQICRFHAWAAIDPLIPLSISQTPSSTPLLSNSAPSATFAAENQNEGETRQPVALYSTSALHTASSQCPVIAHGQSSHAYALPAHGSKPSFVVRRVEGSAGAVGLEFALLAARLRALEQALDSA